MMRVYRWIGALLAIFVALQFGVRGIGAHDTEPAAAAMLSRGAELCPADNVACWHGILPGKSDIGQASSYMDGDAWFGVAQRATDENYQWCWTSGAGDPWRVCLGDVGYPISNTRIESLRIEPPWGTFRLGDAVLIFGQPLQSIICDPVYSPFGGMRYVQGTTFIGSVLYFKNGISVLAYKPWQPNALELTMDMIVLRILYFPTSPIPNAIQAWRGFTRRTHTTGCAG